MLFIYGTRFYGKVRACGTSFVATRFVHLWFVPIFPIGTHLVLESSGDGYRSVPIPFSFLSMLAGYFRVWGPVAVIGAVVSAMEAFEVAESPAAMGVVAVFSAVVVLALLVGTILAYAVLGKLPLDAKRRRAAYALHTGYHVDPAELGQARFGLRDALLGTIAERARHLAGMGYRVPPDPTQLWPQLALDPTQGDEVLVSAAFTLARIEGSLASGPHKAQLDQIHEQLWQRILRTNPPYLHAVA